ncbi:ATP-binding protein [Puia sp. P3]|uniref:ATP-binding protein n=1 Tax=Puia sp. P3 TaxID=3423952 RepID=UPI003D679DA1
MNTQHTVDQLQELKLHGMARAYEAITSQPVHLHPEAHEMVAMLTEAELQSKLHYRTQLFLRLARLRYAVLPEQIQCSVGRNLTRGTVAAALRRCFYPQWRNGPDYAAPPAPAKSYLACALGRQACILGYKTLYYSMSRFLETLATSRVEGSYVKLLNLLARMPVLIFDDFGLQELDHPAKLALLQILEDRYSKGATIITSQLPIKKWYDYLNDATLADAIMDRLSAGVHKIDLKGESLRKDKTN